MKTTFAIAKREFQAYFNSPAAYVVLGVFLLVLGYLYFSTLFLGGFATMRGFFGVAPVLFMIFAPAITMRLISEERKTGTIELLMTLPVTNFNVVLGKFFASLGIVAVGLFFTIPYAVSVSALIPADATFDYGPVIGGYVGLLFMAASFLALGLFASAITKNQIVAFIIGLLFCFIFYFIDKFAVLMPAKIGAIFEFLSVDFHFVNIAKGVIDTRDLIFYLSLVFFSLILTERALRVSKR